MNERARRRLVESALGKASKRAARRKFPCLYSGCSAKAIRSHSQQRERQLRAIADAGLVYAMRRNIYRTTQDGSLPFDKVGIGEASVFFGYCAEHDRVIFADIERTALQQGSARQAYLLFLRAMSYEVAQKRKTLHLYLDLERSLDANAIPSLPTLIAGVRLFIEKEAPYYLSRLFAMLDDAGSAGCAFVWRVIPENIGMSCSSAINPYLDDYREKFDPECAQPIVGVAVVPTPNETHVVLTTLADRAVEAMPMFSALMDDTRAERLLNLLLFGESEDTCVAPALWEGLSNEVRQETVAAMRHDLVRGPLTRIPGVVRLRNGLMGANSSATRKQV